MDLLYPLAFTPVFKERIWGGNKIHTILGLDYSPLPNCGEAWVLSGVEGSQTVVSNGFLRGNELNELVEIYMDDLVGETSFTKFQNQFPILIKFIDSRDWLSIQVHPNDDLAARRRIGNGKTEMWYILETDPGARLISGFKRPVSQKEYLEHLDRKQLAELMNVEEVSPGDVFFMPAGRVHALGPGVLLAEIQQTSDTTYRLYDWDRVDKDGNPRDLHTEEALEAIDFAIPDTYRTSYKRSLNETVNLAECHAFTTNLLRFSRPLEKNLQYLDSFVVYLCTEGSGVLAWENGKEPIRKGEVLLVPASMEKVLLIPDGEATLLEVYLP